MQPSKIPYVYCIYENQYIPTRTGEPMTEYDQETLSSLARIIPSLTHLQKEKLLSFCEGMAFVNEEFRTRVHTDSDSPGGQSGSQDMHE